jgi:hypothetical protein
MLVQRGLTDATLLLDSFMETQAITWSDLPISSGDSDEVPPVNVRHITPDRRDREEMMERMISRYDFPTKCGQGGSCSRSDPVRTEVLCSS